MTNGFTYIDLFAGAGGLSEGFIRAGFTPVAHVEVDKNACDTLLTRAVYYYLSGTNRFNDYLTYLKGELTNRNDFHNLLPKSIKDSVINQSIGGDTNPAIYKRIDVLREEKEVDLIIGGPPCQAYSVVGRSRDPNRMQGDQRNFLFRYYAEFLYRYKPKFFVFENVLGLLSAGNKKYLNEMLRLFEKVGYSTDYQILKSEDFGVLQKRRRVIIIGRKGNEKFEFPGLETEKPEWQIKKDLFFDLPKLKPGQELKVTEYVKPINQYLLNKNLRNGIDFVTQHISRPHNPRDLEIYSIAIEKWINHKTRLKYSDLPVRLQTHKNTQAFPDRFKVVDPFGLSHTVVAHIAKDGHYYIYPDPNQVRSLSVREVARIQSFPDDYFFEGGRSAAFKQIGNAVPPLMAEKIAISLNHLIVNS